MSAAAGRKPPGPGPGPGPGPVSAAAVRVRVRVRAQVVLASVARAVLVLLVGAVAGCSSGTNVEQARETELAAAVERAAEAERKVADQQVQIAELEQQIAALEQQLLEAGGQLPTTSAPDPSDPQAAAADVRLSGNLDELPAGEPGQLQVVAIGTVGRSGRVPWIVRNATDGVVFDVNVVVTARDAQGTLLDSGGTLAVAPFVVPPGEVAIGYSFLGGDDLPDDVDLEVEVSSEVDPFILGVDVPVTELSVREDGITGIVANDSGRALRFVSVVAVCTDDRGIPTHAISEYTDRTDLPAGATSSFSGRLFDVDCSGYLAGASGRA